ncbi:MAG TPA: endonuclease/exonuclease/phosphatase family protein [Micromonosporaceae bacterium]|nr:endonuclease/exonuclease/phosphatase family protein [Micromonosporaceae bacterium]
MTYNIRTGGSGGRRSDIAAVITGQQPDVLALQELRGFDQSGGRLLRAFAVEIGMRPFLAGSWFGQPVAVLVRESARVLAAAPLRRPFHHAAMRVVVATDLGPLTVIGTHLWPYSPRRRRLEARWLAAHADPAAMVVLMGDLNSLDPGTDHTDQLRNLPLRFRSRHMVRGRIDTTVIERLTDAGFVDLSRLRAGGREYTAPTAGFDGAEFHRMRLDYIMATRAAADLAVSWRVVDDGDGPVDRASDHYPVLAELSVRPA